VKTVSLGAGALTLPAFFGSCRGAARVPNVVLVNVDDLGWADVGCFGSRYHETPNIDRLAREGMRFTNAYAACAVCSPTRAAIMTGRYPARIGITDWIRARFQWESGEESIVEDKEYRLEYVGGSDRRLLVPDNPLWMKLEEITLAEALKTAGYATCHVGKWHLGTEDWYPEKQGFDYNFGGCDKGQPPTYFDPYESERYGAGNIPTLEPRQEGEYLTDREADEACAFMTAHRDRPFFLHLAHYAVHTPLEAKADLLEKYQNKESPTEQDSPVYAAMVESVDHAMGQVLDTVDELGLAEDTLVIFTSDNGGLDPQATDNAPLRSGKGYPYEGGIRIPQIMRWPTRIDPGTECSVPASSVDFFPTLCEVAGVPLPSDRPIDGKSLVPLLMGEGDLDREALFWHFPHYRGSDVVPYSIVRAGDWKLIKRYEGKTFELFDLSRDVGETTDLSDERPEKVSELDALLQEWLLETGARVPRENPDYQASASNAGSR
jgi:arylsulfatase A-like enzyme